MQLSSKIFFIICVLSAGNILAQPLVPSTILRAKAQINQAYFTQQPLLLDSVIFALNELDNTGELQKYVHYYTGFAYFRKFPLPLTDDSDLFSNNLDKAASELEKAVKLAPDFAEAYALLGAVYGMKASGMFSGIKYGKKASRAMEKAQKLAPKNPRIYLIDGMGNYYKPKLFGGGVENALHAFLKSQELFESVTLENELAPDWGAAEANAWLAYVYFDLENHKQAKLYLTKALEIEPDFEWVNHHLVPLLDH